MIYPLSQKRYYYPNEEKKYLFWKYKKR